MEQSNATLNSPIVLNWVRHNKFNLQRIVDDVIEIKERVLVKQSSLQAEGTISGVTVASPRLDPSSRSPTRLEPLPTDASPRVDPFPTATTGAPPLRLEPLASTGAELLPTVDNSLPLNTLNPLPPPSATPPP